MAVAANPRAVAKLGARTPVPMPLDTAGIAELPLALRERAQFSAKVESLRLLSRIQDSLETAVSLARRQGMGRDGGDGAYQTREKFVVEMQKLARAEGLDPRNNAATAANYGTLKDITSARRLRLIWDTQMEMAGEYARWQKQQDTDVLAAFPAQEFIRVASRKVPRTDWAQSWLDAGGEGRPDGRMIALKGDSVWRKLSRFGTPWPPFDFGSGMGLRDLSAREAVQLGLMKPGDKVRPAKEDFNAALEASIADLKPWAREELELTFGDRIKITKDTVRWQPLPPSAEPPALPPPLPTRSRAESPAPTEDLPADAVEG